LDDGDAMVASGLQTSMMMVCDVCVSTPGDDAERQRRPMTRVMDGVEEATATGRPICPSLPANDRCLSVALRVMLAPQMDAIFFLLSTQFHAAYGS